MKLVAMGVIIMDMFPSESGKHLADIPMWKPVPGGAPANVAVAAAKLGIPCAFVGKVGKDAFGNKLKQVLAGYGVNVSGLLADEQARTTLNFHAKPSAGVVEYLFYRNPGADTQIAQHELTEEVFEDIQIFHFDSMSLTNEPVKSAIDRAVEWTKKKDGLVSFDANYRQPVWQTASEAVNVITAFAQRADIVKLNETEVELLYPGATPEEAIKRLLEYSVEIAVITLGELGVMIGTRHFCKAYPCFTVNAVDTIGCGDSFIAAFLAGIVQLGRGKKIDEDNMDLIAKNACAAAAITATRQGVIPALPTSNEVQQFLKEIKSNENH